MALGNTRKGDVTMAVAVKPAEKEVERVVLLDSVSWDTYQRLIKEHGERGGTRFTYDGGVLEIMVLSLRHEQPNRVLAALVEAIAEELGVDIIRAGSITISRPDLLKGFESDSCFYIQNVDRVEGRQDLDFLVDPPPDLAIEVDITSSSLDRMPIFAAVGLPEVWRYDGAQVRFFALKDGAYEEVEHSVALPPLTGAVATRFLDESATLKSTLWLRRVREWVRAELKG
jgi:Uma2 family endonuclease